MPRQRGKMSLSGFRLKAQDQVHSSEGLLTVKTTSPTQNPEIVVRLLQFRFSDAGAAGTQYGVRPHSSSTIDLLRHL